MNQYLNLMRSAVLTLVSFFICAFGHPIWISQLSLLAATVGYALFWYALMELPATPRRFLLSTAWFAGVQAAHISFLTSTSYHGAYILTLYVALCVLFGLQFAVLSSFVCRSRGTCLRDIAAIPALWILLEWSRHYILSGFPWSPVGLCLVESFWLRQWAAYVGVYGLSALVMAINLLTFRLLNRIDDGRRWLELSAALSLSLLVGWSHTLAPVSESRGASETSAILVQSGQAPREIQAQNGKHMGEFAFEQWQAAIKYVRPLLDEEIGLIAFPEGFVPYAGNDPVFPLNLVKLKLVENFGPDIITALPSDDGPFVSTRETASGQVPFVGNGYWAQTLANYAGAEVLVGMDDYDQEGGDFKAYNAALCFSPGGTGSRRYAKRILLPMAEYIPFQWASSIAESYGINGSFTPGEEAVVFGGETCPPFSVSICSEETYGALVREGRSRGAEMIVNLTNDGWYPGSRLPQLHFAHSRLRAVESGAPVLRACNTGVTGAVDCYGNVVDVFGDDGIPHEFKGGALRVSVPIKGVDTWYAMTGDGPILGLAFLIAGLRLGRRKA